jgi:hypothetical protein
MRSRGSPRRCDEAAREQLGELRFRAEYEGEFASATDAVFSRDVLARASAPLVLPQLSELCGHARLLGGCDWGASFDRSTLVAIGRLPLASLNPDLELPVFGVAALRVWDAGAPLPDVVEEIAASPAHWACLSMETNGIGHGPSQALDRLLKSRPPESGGRRPGGFVAIDVDAFLERRERLATKRQAERELARAFGLRPPEQARPFRVQTARIATTAELKAQTYGRLRYLMDRGQLVLPSDTPLVRELAALRMELRPSGSVGIDAETGHDDVADAAMLACGPYKDRHGAWRSLLTDAAEHQIATDLNAGGRVVETGDGLRVWRRPLLQSIDGLEVTAPDGVRLRRGSEPPELAALRLRIAQAVDAARGAVGNAPEPTERSAA